VITRQQHNYLRTLAVPQRYRVTARDTQIRVTNRYMAASFSNNEAGYWAALALLAVAWQAREAAKAKEKAGER
jgi:hypothetical protein